MLWIPDEENETNLSGKLSHDINFNIPYTYIGIQSRFSNYVKNPSSIEGLSFDVLIVLSGVEPQRSFLENKLKQQFQVRNEKVLLVKGKTESYSISEEGNITTISYLNTNDLFAALQKAPVIICRSGYSTVMDLAVLGKKAILIPAKGQTEQEYLARTLAEKSVAVECKQDKIDIESAMKKLEMINGFSMDCKTQNTVLEVTLDKYLT